MSAYGLITDRQAVYPNVVDTLASPGPAGLMLTVQVLDDVSVFRCAGRITAGSEDLLRTAVYAESAGRTIVLDLADVTAIDAAGLGLLVFLRGWAKANGTAFKLMNLTPRVEEVFHVTHLAPAFEICSFREMMALMCQAYRLERSGSAAA
jgi:anti-anti-sigma factor